MENNNKHTPLTLQDCKDKIAKKLMYSSWHDATASTAINPLVTIKALHDEAAELYASQFTRELSELREENERLKEAMKRIDKYEQAQSTPDLFEVLKEIRNAEQMTEQVTRTKTEINGNQTRTIS